MYTKNDFVELPSLPRYKKFGDPKLGDPPPNALVTVFFTMNTYISSRTPPTPRALKTSTQYGSQTPIASGSSSHGNNSTPAKQSSTQSDNTPRSGPTQVLSPNLQFLIFHGLIPEDD